MTREYQTIAEANIIEAWGTHQRVMFCLATGLGKTVLVTNLIRHLLSQGKRIIFIAHREELISQAWNTFHRHQIMSGIIKSGIKQNYSLQVQIGSIQTMIRRKELPKADYVFIDESHHVLEDNSYGKILNQHYRNSFALGVTATPYRLGGKGFTKIFSHLIESLQLAEGISQGYLVPLELYVCSMPDMSKVHLSAGDYKEDESMKAMALAPIVESYKDHADGKNGICFAVNVQHSQKIVEQYNAAGIKAEHVDANTDLDMRRGIFQRLRDKKIQVVVNVGIATEGVDIPNIDFIQFARPTKSLSLFFQMLGRGTRADNEIIKHATSDEHRKFLISCSSKSHCIVLDNAGLITEHGLPDEPINWQRHFMGYKKPKKTIEEMIEIIEFVAEDSSGREVKSKIPKEIEGMKLIRIDRSNREKIINLISIKEFDRLYALFKRLPQISKPGYKAYFEYRDYCVKNSFLMDDDVWSYLIDRLSTQFHPIEQTYKQDAARKINRINEVYKDAVDNEFLTTKVNQRLNSDLAELAKFRVPSGFLRKEKEKY